MADTARTLAALQALLADNTSGDISPQDVRDMLVSLFPQTAKGDLPGLDAASIIGRLPATTDGFVLTLDSTQTYGFKWAAAGGHDEVHAPESHSDTDITGAELETLSDGSDADALHNHPSDLTPAEHTASGDAAPHHAQEHGDADHTPDYALFSELHASFLQADADLLYEALGDIATHAALVDVHHAEAHTLASHSTKPYVASATQTVIAANAILANAPSITIDAAGAVTMTATPTIAAGVDGQVLTILNVDTVDAITLQDAGVLAGSLLRLGASTRALATGGGSIDLVYSTDVGAWVEVAFNTLVTITPSINSFTINIGAGAASSQNAEVANAGTHPSTFAMTYTGVPSAAEIDVSAGGDPGTDWPTTVLTPFTSHVGPAFNKGTSVSTVRTFTLSATVNGQAKTRNSTVTYINRRYAGPDNNGGQLSSVEILALDATAAGQSGLSNSKYGTFLNIDTAAGEYIYYAYRSALGTVAWFSVENEIAKFTSEGIMSHTNDSGFIEDFQQYRSDNTNLGANKDFRSLSSQPNNRIYMGPAANATDVIANAEILALDDTADGESIVSGSLARTYTNIQIETGEYLWFVHPDRIADLATIKDATTGFGIAGSYRDNVTHTNQWGYAETYRCWRSDNPAIFPTGENVVVT